MITDTAATLGVFVKDNVSDSFCQVISFVEDKKYFNQSRGKSGVK